MTPSEAAEALKSSIFWIDENLVGIELPNDERSALANGCLDVAIEHQAAIAVLHEAELHGSMLALLRVLFESVTRGFWLLHCATEKELEKFKKGKLEKTQATLVREIEQNTGAFQSVLSNLQSNAWNTMNAFTHSGFKQVVRRHSNGILGASYNAPEITRSLYVASILGLVAAGQLAELSGRKELLSNCIALMKKQCAKTFS